MKKFKMSFVMLLSLALVFTVSPIVYAQNVENITFETVSHMEEHHLDFVDLNDKLDEIGIDGQLDFNDKWHLCYSGAEKTTDYLSGIIKNYLDE